MSIAFYTSAHALAQDVDERSTVLHLSQTAERSVVRDVLRVELRVEETGADARSVQAAINRRMAAALDRARQVQGVRLETGSYNVGEEHPQNGPSQWRGSQSMILTGKDSDSVLKLAGALQSDGLSTSSLAYDTAPETVRGAEEDLTAEALRAPSCFAPPVSNLWCGSRPRHCWSYRTADRRAGHSMSSPRRYSPADAAGSACARRTCRRRNAEPCCTPW
jgi:hypothetical protein